MSTPSTFTRHIKADRAGIIEMLQERVDAELHTLPMTTTKKEQARKKAFAAGIEFAIGVLEDWDEILPESAERAAAFDTARRMTGQVKP